MRHLVSSMCITQGYEWQITLALGQQRPLETGCCDRNVETYIWDVGFSTRETCGKVSYRETRPSDKCTVQLKCAA